jgi:hypothetical protein
MIRPPGIDNGAFVMSPSTVWYSEYYARVLLLFAASATTDTGSFECDLVSTLKTYNDPENGYFLLYFDYSNYVHYC